MKEAGFSKILKVMPGGIREKFAPAWMILKILVKKPRGYRNALLSLFSETLRSSYAFGNPVSITLEPSNMCNLRCPVCETGAGILGRKPQMMSYESFVKIMDKVGPKANHLMFYFMGEPFLNRDAYRMIRYARDMGLYVTTCTNGEYVDPEALYASRINNISFQIGGVTQETHQVYRVQSDFSKVFGNLKSYLKIIGDKGRKAGEHKVELGLIVMKQNEGEIEAFLKLGRDLKVRATLIPPCVRTPEQGRQYLPKSEPFWVYDRERLEKDDQLVIKRLFPWNSCPWIYYAITIQVDGTVVPCCRDPHGKFPLGNLLCQTLEEVWNGPEFRKFRLQLLKTKHPLPLCHLCPGEGMPMLK